MADTVDDINPALRTLNYGNYGISLFMGHAGFISSTVGCRSEQLKLQFQSTSSAQRLGFRVPGIGTQQSLYGTLRKTFLLPVPHHVSTDHNTWRFMGLSTYKYSYLFLSPSCQVPNL